LKPLQDYLKTREDRQRAVLDRLVTLVGGYSLLIGLTAFLSLKLAAEDAEKRLTLLKEQVNQRVQLATEQVQGFLTMAESQMNNAVALAKDQVASTVESTGAQLKLLETAASGQVEEFKTRIAGDLPDMRAMQAGLRSLLFDLEQLVPSVQDWNDERYYNMLTEAQRQEILISEWTVGALPTLISRDAAGNRKSLAGIYRTMARFYFGRYKVEKAPADSGRADAYLTRALLIEPEHAGSYRLRGAIYLAEQRLNPAPAGQPDALLNEAERNLRLALEKDKNDLGAHYNLALALTRRTGPAKAAGLDEAIELIRLVLGRLSDFPEQQKRKYMDSVALNQACDLNAKARATNDPLIKKPFQEEAVRTLTEGLDYLVKNRNARGLASLRASIEREIAPGNDLDDLPADQKDLLLRHQAAGALTQP
jgi:hypothetical protein